jgi:predicted RNase H-like HicB family nuclease
MRAMLHNRSRSRRRGVTKRHVGADSPRPRAVSRKGCAPLSRYVVRYSRDADGTWIATVPSVPGCHTYGRTLEQARVRILEALSLFVDGVEATELVDRVTLPTEARVLLQRVKRSRTRAAVEQQKASNATAKAVRYLTRTLGLSTRDAGKLLELSHQRVQQLSR